MQLNDAIRTYLICITAEGLTRPVANQYRHTLNLFLDVMGDMDVLALTPKHIRRFLRTTSKIESRRVHYHGAVLRFFVDWLRVQDHIRTFADQGYPSFMESGQWPITPQQAPVRYKLPLAF